MQPNAVWAIVIMLPVEKSMHSAADEVESTPKPP